MAKLPKFPIAFRKRIRRYGSRRMISSLRMNYLKKRSANFDFFVENLNEEEFLSKISIVHIKKLESMGFSWNSDMSEKPSKWTDTSIHLKENKSKIINKKNKKSNFYVEEISFSNEELNKAYQPNFRARAILRGQRMMREDLEAAGGAYDLSQVREVLGSISRQAVHDWVKQGKILAVPGPNRSLCYPTMQFENNGLPVDGLKDTLKAFPTRNPWGILNFLVRPEGRLNGEKPIDLLRRGEIEKVVETARRIGVQGT